MIDRMDERLGHPDRCPHGWPLDTDAEQAENRELQPLAELEPGERATIVRLAEHDGELLHWFYDEGLVPGAEVEVDTTGENFRVRLDGAEREIGERAAAGLYVRPAA